MALRYLPNTEMVTLTRTWVDRSHLDYQLLRKRPMLAALLPEIEAAHQEMLRSLPQPGLEERLDKISGELAETDRLHDNLLRGFWYRFWSEEYFAADKDEKVAEMFCDLREFFVPHGLQMVNFAYRQEVGHAEMVSSQLTAKQVKLLGRLATYDGDLHGKVLEWLAAADRLGVLDHERTGILPETSSMSSGDIMRARNRWLRVIGLVLQLAELHPDDIEVQELAGRVHKFDAEVERRRARAAAAAAAADDAAADADDAAADAENDAGAGSAATGDAGEMAATLAAAPAAATMDAEMAATE